MGSPPSGSTWAATLTNANIGVWYIRVRGATASVQNNYRFDLELTGP